MPNFYGSHQKILFEVVRLSNGPVLELGAGEFSTVQLHDMLKGRKLVTYDGSEEWLNKYLYLKDEFHDFVSGDANVFYANDNEQWGVVFIDNGSWEDRIAAIYKYKDTADYLIIHDSDAIGNQWMIDKYLMSIIVNKEMKALKWPELFKYWKEFRLIDYVELSPYTLVGSNKIDVSSITAEGMI